MPGIPEDGLTYEQAMAELEKLIGQLEDGQLPLEQTLALYERGRELAALCAEMLEKAELKVRTLSADKPGSSQTEL
jgi:exodeoxyribonuclease VII small subunit